MKDQIEYWAKFYVYLTLISTCLAFIGNYILFESIRYAAIGGLVTCFSSGLMSFCFIAAMVLIFSDAGQ